MIRIPVLAVLFILGCPRASLAGGDATPRASRDMPQSAAEAPRHAESERPTSFRFLDESGRPIKGTFTLHEYDGGEFKRNIHRDLPLGGEGAITLKNLPAEFQFGGSSSDGFYHFWFRSDELDPRKQEFTRKCKPSGAMTFRIAGFPKVCFRPLVVEYYKKSGKAGHSRVKGIGVFPGDTPHVIGGLEPGEYYIAIKYRYEDRMPLFESQSFTVALKKCAKIPDIKISKELALKLLPGDPEN